MIAVIVTEYVWTAPGFWRTGPYEARPRTGHIDPACSRIDPDAIVARNVEMSSRAAGLPCSYCVPVVDGPFGPPARPARGPSPSPREPGPEGRDDLVVLRRRNAYPGNCVRCGTRVAANAGRLARGTRERLSVICEECSR